MDIVFMYASAVFIGGLAAILVLVLGRRRLSLRRAAVTITGLSVLYHAAALKVMAFGSTSIDILNVLLALGSLGAWGLGAPTGDIGWAVFLTFSLQALGASAIGIVLYSEVKKQSNREQKVGQVSSGDAPSASPDEPST